MKVNKIRFALMLAGASSLVGAAPAWAIGVDLVGAGVYSMAIGTPTPTASFGYPGGGLIFNFRLGSKVDLQLGALYLTRNLDVGGVQAQTMIDGIGGLKFKFSRAFFLNVGGYYNYSLTDPLTSLGSDYGADVGIGIVLPLGSTVGLLINPRYHYSLNARTYGTGAYTPHEVLGLVGLSFGMGSKN